MVHCERLKCLCQLQGLESLRNRTSLRLMLSWEISEQYRERSALAPVGPNALRDRWTLQQLQPPEGTRQQSTG